MLPLASAPLRIGRRFTDRGLTSTQDQTTHPAEAGCAGTRLRVVVSTVRCCSLRGMSDARELHLAQRTACQRHRPTRTVGAYAAVRACVDAQSAHTSVCEMIENAAPLRGARTSLRLAHSHDVSQCPDIRLATDGDSDGRLTSWDVRRVTRQRALARHARARRNESRSDR